MTVTDEDKALFVALMGYDSETIDAILGGNAFTWEVEQIAKYRQAACAAGLERAAVRLETLADERDAMKLPKQAAKIIRQCAYIIRAEKGKTNDRD